MNERAATDARERGRRHRDLEESPWGDLRGKPLDPRGLAWRLRKYEIRPGTHRFGNVSLRGYLREDFQDAWQRYLVADVVDVAVPETPRETVAGVVVPEDEEGDDILSIDAEGSHLRNGGPQQPQHAQHTPSQAELDARDEGWAARGAEPVS